MSLPGVRPLPLLANPLNFARPSSPSLGIPDSPQAGPRPPLAPHSSDRFPLELSSCPRVLSGSHPDALPHLDCVLKERVLFTFNNWYETQCLMISK